MKLKILTFPNGQMAYLTGDIHIEINGKIPKSIQEFEDDEKTVKSFFNEPRKFNINLKKGKIIQKI